MNANPDQIISCLRIIGEHLLNGLILSGAIYAGSVIAFRWLFRAQRWSASTRYQVSLVLFLVLAVTPVATLFKPAAPQSNARPEQVLTSDPASEELPSSSGLINTTPDKAGESKHHLPPPKFWFRWIDWPFVIAVSWAIFAAACLFRLALAIDRLLILQHSAIPLTVSPNLTVRRKITIARSSLISSPVAVGLWAPKVLVPANFQSGFSAQDQDNVLRHEIAHLERFDDWSNLIQQICIALFPINPFLWIQRRRLRLLEEIACDDWALVGVEHPRNYANLLTRLAADHQTGTLLVSGVSRPGKQLYQRVSRILDKNCDRSLKPSWRNIVWAGLAVICISIGGLIWLPAVTASAQTQEVHRIPDTRHDQPAPLSSEVIALLKNSALNDSDAGVRREAVDALSDANGDEATSAVLDLLNESKDEQVKLLILRKLNRERIGEARVKEKLIDLASQEQALPIRIAAMSALARNIDDGVVEKFIAIYRSSSEHPIKEACLRGLAGRPSKTAKDFLMSVAKDDPDPAMRRVAVRAVSGAMGRRIFMRVGNPAVKGMFFKNRGAMIDGNVSDDLDYLPFGQFPDGENELFVQPGSDIDLSDDSEDNGNAEPLTQRLRRLRERIRTIPLPKVHGDQPESRSDMPPLPESPSNNPSASPSPTR
jgi:beta-lactamase regulating signal transducer with metallopeptidase domain